MSFFRREKKEEITSLNIEQAETTAENTAEAGQEQPFDSAKAEQMELFAQDKSVEQIGRERVEKAVEAGKRTFTKVGGFFKSSWNKGKAGAGKALAYAAAPDAIAREIEARIDSQRENLSDASEHMQDTAREKFDGVGANMDAFVDRTKDSLLSKYAEKIGLRENGMVPKIKSPEAKTSILGLDGDERSMGGELIVGGTIFDRVKEFARQMKAIRAQYEVQKAAQAERRKAGEAWLQEKERNKVTGRKVAEGVAMKRAEDEERSVIMSEVALAQSGEYLHFDSFDKALEFMAKAKQFGVEVDMSGLKLEIGQRKEPTAEAAAESEVEMAA